MIYFVILTTLMFILLLMTLFYLLRYRTMYTDLSRQQHAFNKKFLAVSEKYNSLKNTYKQDRSFTDDLLKIDSATTKLRISQSTYFADVKNTSVPERYQYISSATVRGADAFEIARLFSISTHEAEQLSTLSRLSTK